MYVFDREDNGVIGTVMLSDWHTDVRHRCTLSYGIAGTHEGKGYMFESVVEAIRYAFDDLWLHRVEATCEPTNDRSKNLLVRLGFRTEGELAEYLFIDGNWKDVVLMSILNKDWTPR